MELDPQLRLSTTAQAIIHKVVSLRFASSNNPNNGNSKFWSDYSICSYLLWLTSNDQGNVAFMWQRGPIWSGDWKEGFSTHIGVYVCVYACVCVRQWPVRLTGEFVVRWQREQSVSREQGLGKSHSHFQPNNLRSRQQLIHTHTHSHTHSYIHARRVIKNKPELWGPEVYEDSKSNKTRLSMCLSKKWSKAFTFRILEFTPAEINLRSGSTTPLANLGSF